MAIGTFEWASGGRPVTPEQARRQRAVAEALIGRTQTPAANWAEGLSHLAGAYTGTVLQDRAAEAELAGAEEVGGLFNGLSSASPEQDIISALTNPWTTPQQASVAQALLGDQLNAEAAGQESFFGTGVPIQNEDGSISYGQFGNRGSFNIPELGEGQSFLTPVQQLNTGTGFTGVDKFGNQTGTVTPIDNFGAAQDSALGTAIGKAAADKILSLPQTLSTSNNMIATIDGVLNDPALDTSTGWLAWMQGVPGSDQYRFGQRALQLQGQSFLQAFDSLKGAGQITEVEGTKATQAIGRLSTAQNAADYRDALNELKGIIEASKKRAVDAAASVPLPANSAIQPPVVQTAPDNNDPLGIR